MADRYSDREFGRYGEGDDERREDDDYGRERGLFGRGPDYSGPAPRGYRVVRDYDDYERDRDYFSGPRDRGYGSYGSQGSHGGYTGREYGREAGRDYEGTGRVYEGGGRDYERYEPRYEPRYERTGGRDYGRDAGREHEAGHDTDYGRTTSRFFGRDRGETLPGQVPPDYGDDYERRRGRDDDYERRGREGFRHERGERRGHEAGGRGRGWVDRAADEVLSWFGDEDANRRRHLDDSRSGRTHRGRGPRNYRRSDERIREDINDRLTEHDWLDASDVEVSVTAGEVTLSGAVESRHAKRLAEDIAESVVGVTNVQNNLRVRREQRTSPNAGDYAAGSTLTSGRAAATTDPSGLTGTADTTADTEVTRVNDDSARAAGSNS